MVFDIDQIGHYPDSKKIRDFDIFRKRTPRKLLRIKNLAIWISICGEIKEQNLKQKIICEERGTKNKSRSQIAM